MRGFLVLVHERKDDDFVPLDHEKQRIGKATQHRLANLVFYLLIKRGQRSKVRLGSLEFLDEGRRLIDLGSSFTSRLQPRSQQLPLAYSEPSMALRQTQLRLDVVKRNGLFVGMFPMMRQTRPKLGSLLLRNGR